MFESGGFLKSLQGHRSGNGSRTTVTVRAILFFLSYTLSTLQTSFARLICTTLVALLLQRWPCYKMLTSFCVTSLQRLFCRLICCYIVERLQKIILFALLYRGQNFLSIDI